MNELITILTYALIHIVEARLELVVILLKNYQVANYNPLNKQEHFWSALLAFLVFAYIAAILVFLQAWWMLASAVVTRRIFFDFFLKIYRKRRPYKIYEGNDWWVRNFFIPIFGKNGRIKELVFSVLIWSAGIILQFIIK